MQLRSAFQSCASLLGDEHSVEQRFFMADAAGVTENIGAFTADTGYFSEENMNALDSNERINDVFIATGRQKHNDKVPDSPKGRPPKNLTAKEKMARRNRTKKGRAEYARRKVIIEPVFGQIKAGLGFRNFLLRGLEKMQGEWTLVCLAHNLKRLHGMVGSMTNGAGGPKSPSMARKPSGISLVSDWLGEIVHSISPRSLRLLAEFSAERALTPTGS